MEPTTEIRVFIMPEFKDTVPEKIGEDIGGYDVQFVSDPPDCLVCLICTLVARDPQQMDCCGRIYCQVCLSEHKKHSDKCPQCREVGNCFSDKRSNREIQALLVKCTNVASNCDWTGELRELHTHLQTSCGYQQVQCSNSCKEGKEILRRDLEEHLKTSCPLRKHKCGYCEEEGQYEERVGVHLDTCPGVSVDCPNEGCNKRYPRGNASSHANVCDYETVACKYAEVRCTEKLLRKDTKEHEEDNTIHLQMAINTILELKEDFKKQNVKILASKSEHTIMIPSFEAVIKNDPLQSGYKSPSFYCKGYNMFLAVDVKDSDIGVYIYLMKGKFDNNLTWPFPGTVIIELLNQLENSNHYQYRLTFPAEKKCSQRVLNKTSNGGWGCPSFIAQSKLDRRPFLNCQYLKNDTLIFRVSVETPDYKPWLECDL